MTLPVNLGATEMVAQSLAGGGQWLFLPWGDFFLP